MPVQSSVFNRRRFIRFVAMGMGWFYLPHSHALPTDFPLTVTDALKRRVVISKQPQRIVTIFSSNTEIVAALGLADRIVGIDGYTHYPNSINNIPKIGGRLGFSLDSIVAQRPDLVIMTPARQATHQLLRPLGKLGIPALVLEGGSLHTIFQNILLVSQATGVNQQGQQLVSSMRQRLNKIRHDNLCQRAPRVVLITGKAGNGLLLVARRNGPKTNGYTADIVLHAGGALALDEQPASGLSLSQISPEVLLGTDPDIVLFAGHQSALDELIAATPGWQQMKAARSGFVRTVSRAELLIPGPRVIDGVASLAGIFRQWCASP